MKGLFCLPRIHLLALLGALAVLATTTSASDAVAGSGAGSGADDASLDSRVRRIESTVRSQVDLISSQREEIKALRDKLAEHDGAAARAHARALQDQEREFAAQIASMRNKIADLRQSSGLADLHVLC